MVQNGGRHWLLEPLTGERCPVNPAGQLTAPRLANGALYYLRFEEKTNSSAVWQTNADGSSHKLEFTSQPASEAFMMDFLVSQDGRQIAWTAVAGTVDSEGNQQLASDLWIADADGNNQLQLLDDYGFEDGRRVLPLRFNSDGGRLYFAMQPAGLGGIWTSYTGRYANLYQLDTAGGEPTLLFDCGEQTFFLCIGDFHMEEALVAHTDSGPARLW